MPAKACHDFIMILLEPGEVITSFDVKAMFTFVPIKPAIQIVKQRLQQDNILLQRTVKV